MKTYVWTLPTRIFHWLLAFYILMLFITSWEENLLTYHVAFGYGVTILILFRLVWGFLGPPYSRFRDWPFGKLKEFIKDPSTPYLSHNPAASWVMIGMILSILLTSIVGMLTYGIQEGRGVFAFLHSPYYEEMEILEELHESLAYFTLFLIFLHLGGVTLDTLLHRERGVLKSMINGYKNMEGESVKLTPFQKFLATIFLSLAVVVPLITIMFSTPLTKSIYSPHDYEEEAYLFKQECGACHTLYPPFLLPSSSWKKMMSTLEDHFGDDASLDPQTTKEIENFLVKNSAQHSTKEASFYILKSLDGKEAPLAITQTPFWKEKHSSIPKERFEKVKSKANCKACHLDIETGMIEDDKIKMD